MIVSFSNEAITYVNQQTEEKSAKMLKRAQQESAIITSSNISHMKQDCKLLLLSHCQIYIET